MIAFLAYTTVAAYGLTLCLLLPFAGHRTYLWLLARRERPARDRGWTEGDRATGDEGLPPVTVQLPVYNERHVVERLIDAACRLDYPRDLLEIQVLDDSDDETVQLVADRVRRWRWEGIDVRHLRRAGRDGFKAGALALGMREARGELLLVLDADFVPEPGLIRELLPPFRDPDVGMVQARWDHLNAEDSWLTAAQALLLDGHFFFEQGGRYRGGRFFNFNGTAGLWRKTALEEAGGWSFDTLTEDLDVSYRAQMAGWRFVFREDVGVPAELPSSVGALMVQQKRWAQGGIQTARKILPALFRSRVSAAIKLEAFVHLCGHLAHPLTLALALLIFPAAVARRAVGMDELWWLDLALFASATGPFLFFYAAAAKKGGRDRWLMPTLNTIALGVGMSLFLTRPVLRGLKRVRDPFERTPKWGRARLSAYDRRGGPPEARVALAIGGVLALEVVVSTVTGLWASAPFMALFALGFLRLGRGVGDGRPLSPQSQHIVEQQPPDRKPDYGPHPAWLRPYPRRLVGPETPVAEEYEPA